MGGPGLRGGGCPVVGGVLHDDTHDSNFVALSLRTSTLHQRKGGAPLPSITCGGGVVGAEVIHDNDDAD